MMNPAIMRHMQRVQASETPAEHVIRSGIDRKQRAHEIRPAADRSALLLRMWARPEEAAYLAPRHARRVFAQAIQLRPKHWRRAWAGTAVFLAVPLSGVPDTIDTATTLGAVTAGGLAGTVIAALGIGTGGALALMRVGADKAVTDPLEVSVKGWFPPADYETSVQWQQLHALATTYVEIRGWLDLHGRAARGHDAVEELRYELRCAALAFRKYRAARDGVWKALGGQAPELAEVPRAQALDGLDEFDRRMEAASEAIAALHPLALASRIESDLVPVAIPRPIRARAVRNPRRRWRAS